MNEIDDTYKQEEEDLDNQFVESHNIGRTKESTIKKYLDGIKNSRERFKKNYVKHFKKEKWKIWHTKKKKRKERKAGHLKIAHFGFEFNIFQKIMMKLNIFFFEIRRIFSRTFVQIVPRLVMYVFYKTVKTISAFFRDFGDYISKKKTRIISGSIIFFKKLWAKLDRQYSKIIEKIGSLLGGSKKKDKDGKDLVEKEEKKESSN